jgi:ArsR family transcriptional regulator
MSHAEVLSLAVNGLRRCAYGAGYGIQASSRTSTIRQMVANLCRLFMQANNISILLELSNRLDYLYVMDLNLVVRALSALAHESRLAIFRTLVVAGPDGLPAGEIAQTLGLAPSSLSFHLKDLSHAELVGARHEGRFVIYSANFGAMTDLIGFLTENCCSGEPCAANDLSNCCGDST